eukprot:g7970.t1
MKKVGARRDHGDDDQYDEEDDDEEEEEEERPAKKLCGGSGRAVQVRARGEEFCMWSPKKDESLLKAGCWREGARPFRKEVANHLSALIKLQVGMVPDSGDLDVGTVNLIRSAFEEADSERGRGSLWTAREVATHMDDAMYVFNANVSDALGGVASDLADGEIDEQQAYDKIIANLVVGHAHIQSDFARRALRHVLVEEMRLFADVTPTWYDLQL